MTPEWFLYYGLMIGMTRDETLSIPYSQLLDLIAVHQIKQEGAEAKPTEAEEMDDFMRLLSYK